MICPLSAIAQSYFLSLPDHPETFNRKLLPLSNGDILIGDSSDEGATQPVNGKIYLIRLDHCGDVIWSYSYERTTEYLEFRDLAVDGENNVYVYGSAYRGGQEMLFLMKVNPSGELSKFKLIETGTVDHFSYSLDLRDGVLMLYGLLLHFDTQKLGFISVFDQNLNFQWARRFSPFESEGDAIIDKNGNFICRSGPFHYGLDQDGNTKWLIELDVSGGVHSIGGPLEIDGGYLFQGVKGDHTFFYKLNPSANLEWVSTSRKFSGRSSTMGLQSDGNGFAVFKTPMGNANSFSYVHIDKKTGELSDHLIFNSSRSIDTDEISSFMDEEYLYVLGNKVLSEKYPIDIPYFLLKMTLNDKEECFGWDRSSESQLEPFLIRFHAIDTTSQDSPMIPTEVTSQTLVFTYDFPIGDVCMTREIPEIKLLDTVLACSESWKVTLPDGFFWEDGFPELDRDLNSVGLFRARFDDCSNPEILEFNLDMPDCNCNIFLPNAITPNGDGVNDSFQLFSDCNIDQYHVSVYNRWGIKLYEGSNSDWSGYVGNKQVLEGMHVIVVDYQLLDNAGNREAGRKVQQVLILR